MSWPVLHHPFSLLAFPLVCSILLEPDGIGGVVVFSGPRLCVSVIQLSVDVRSGVISACSDASSPFQLTMIGLPSSVPHASFAPLLELRKKGGEVRPVSPIYVFAPKMSAARRRTCHDRVKDPLQHLRFLTTSLLYVRCLMHSWTWRCCKEAGVRVKDPLQHLRFLTTSPVYVCCLMHSWTLAEML